MQTVPPTSPSSSSLTAFLESCQASGRYSFTRAEALGALGVSEVALQHAVYRLVAKRRLVVPRRGFYVIVPLEYRSAGAPPPAWYVDALMRFQGRPYYVGVLSAAALHGAAHQQPQEFQIVTDAPLRPVTVGRVPLRFLVKRHIEATPTAPVKTETGAMQVSTPEATAVDLVRYVDAAGGVAQAAGVLAELAERLDPALLVKAAAADVELSVVQRLGYLLDRVGAERVATELAKWLPAARPRRVPLRPDRPVAGAALDARWHLIINDTIEVEP